MGLNAKSNEPLQILQLKSSSMVRVPVCVHGRSVNAIIDTASEVTLISDKFYSSFENKPPVEKEFTLFAAGRKRE